MKLKMVKPTNYIFGQKEIPKICARLTAKLGMVWKKNNQNSTPRKLAWIQNMKVFTYNKMSKPKMLLQFHCFMVLGRYHANWFGMFPHWGLCSPKLTGQAYCSNNVDHRTFVFFQNAIFWTVWPSCICQRIGTRCEGECWQRSDCEIAWVPHCQCQMWQMWENCKHDIGIANTWKQMVKLNWVYNGNGSVKMQELVAHCAIPIICRICRNILNRGRHGRVFAACTWCAVHHGMDMFDDKAHTGIHLLLLYPQTNTSHSSWLKNLWVWYGIVCPIVFEGARRIWGPQHAQCQLYKREWKQANWNSTFSWSHMVLHARNCTQINVALWSRMFLNFSRFAAVPFQPLEPLVCGHNWQTVHVPTWRHMSHLLECWNVLEWLLQLFCFSNKGGGSLNPTVRRQRCYGCYEWALCQTSSTTSRHVQTTPKKNYKICVFGFTLIPCGYPNPRSWVVQPKLAKPTVNWVSWALQRPAGSPASRHPLCRQNPQRHIHQD